MSTPRFSRLDPEQRREQILDAANALFAERAYDEVSIEDIADAPPASPAGSCTTTSAAARTSTSGCWSDSAPSASKSSGRRGRSARARVADTVSRWLDWTEANRTIWLATMAHGEDIADPEVRRVVADLVRRAVALLAAYHADIAEDSPRLRHALECWTGLNRAATRRWLAARPPARRRTSARLDARARPAHVRHSTRAKPAHIPVLRRPIELHARQPRHCRCVTRQATIALVPAPTLRRLDASAPLRVREHSASAASIGTHIPCSAPNRREFESAARFVRGSDARIWHEYRVSA